MTSINSKITLFRARSHEDHNQDHISFFYNYNYISIKITRSQFYFYIYYKRGCSHTFNKNADHTYLYIGLHGQQKACSCDLAPYVHVITSFYSAIICADFMRRIALLNVRPK